MAGAVTQNYYRGIKIQYPTQYVQENDNLANADAGEIKLNKKPFYKKLRKYQYFEVQKVPYMDYINDYICYFKTKQEKNENLLYFKNRAQIARLALFSEYAAWFVTIVFALVYAFTNENYGKVWLTDIDGNSIDDWTIQLDSSFLTIIGLTFVVPLVFRVTEAWSNAVMTQLFDQLVAR